MGGGNGRDYGVCWEMRGRSEGFVKGVPTFDLVENGEVVN